MYTKALRLLTTLHSQAVRGVNSIMYNSQRHSHARRRTREQRRRQRRRRRISSAQPSDLNKNKLCMLISMRHAWHGLRAVRCNVGSNGPHIHSHARTHARSHRIARVCSTQKPKHIDGFSRRPPSAHLERHVLVGMFSPVRKTTHTHTRGRNSPFTRPYYIAVYRMYKLARPFCCCGVRVCVFCCALCA